MMNEVKLTEVEKNNVSNMVKEWQKLRELEAKLADEKRAFKQKLEALNPDESYVYNITIIT